MLRVLARPDEWRGVSSAGITAAYEAELTEVAESTATLAQPTISSEKGHVFVPFLIEIGPDWSTIAQELARLMADAEGHPGGPEVRDRHRNERAIRGVTGGTNTVNAAAGQTFTRANGFSLIEALPPATRRTRASWPTSGSSTASASSRRRAARRSRNGGDGGGAGGLGGPVHGQAAPAGRASSPDTPGTGNKFLLYGDFTRYVIIERIGTTIERSLSSAERRPTGSEGCTASSETRRERLDLGRPVTLRRRRGASSAGPRLGIAVGGPGRCPNSSPCRSPRSSSSSVVAPEAYVTQSP